MADLNPTTGLPAEAHAAAEAEAGKGPVLTIGGRKVEFAARPPLGIAPAAQMQRVDLIFRLLARGDEDLLEHLILHMSEQDLEDLFTEWGVAMGESEASATS